MSIFVEFDEHTFRVTKVTRHDRHALDGAARDKPEGARSWSLEDATTRGRSVAHQLRYLDAPGKPA